jgi:hypothetical protein
VRGTNTERMVAPPTDGDRKLPRPAGLAMRLAWQQKPIHALDEADAEKEGLSTQATASDAVRRQRRSNKNGPLRGPEYCKQERSERLSGGLLCDWSAEFERPVFFPATRYQSDDGAKERHDCDFLGHGDPHHCHGGVSISSPPGWPQHGIAAKGYFVQQPVR